MKKQHEIAQENDDLAVRFVDHLATLDPVMEENLCARLAYNAAMKKQPLIDFLLRTALKAQFFQEMEKQP